MKEQKFEALLQVLEKNFRGQKEIIEFSLAAFFGGGHILLEGPPGVGKTSFAKSLAKVLGGSFSRVQMTSDLLPSDIIGILRLQPGGSEFEFRKGPIFSNFLLADELNRTGPKTQSALLEAMAEGTVTVDGTSHPLPDPFFVIATQNPLEFHGVYPLVESQRDRFMLQLIVGFPERNEEIEIYEEPAQPGQVQPLFTGEDVRHFRQKAQNIHIEKSVREYATDLVRATRVLDTVSSGVSVRGGLQLLAAGQSLSLIRGRDYLHPEDLQDLAVAVLSHRLCFFEGEVSATHRRGLIEKVIEKVKAPR